MPVIALTQEMGSLAKDVALRLADVGKLAVMRNEVVDNVAGRMQVPASLVRRLREGKAGFVERLSTDKEQVALFTAEEVFAQAVRGNVVLRGWGATCLLRPVQHVVCVRVTRPFEQRVAWLMEHLGTEDREAAEAEVRRSDHAHASRMHAQFGVTWGDPLLYDMVLNTDRVSVEGCVEQILQLARRPEFQETAESANPYIGRLNNSRVRAALKATLDGFLSGMVLDEMLVGYTLDVSATRAQEINGQAIVTMTLLPTFSIDYIKVIMNLS